MFKIIAIHEYINQSKDFAAKFSNTKNGFQKRYHTTNIKNNFDDVTAQPTYLSMGYLVYEKAY